MVFQNPDNQIIGTIVEEDVGFGPENMGIPTEDIWKRVDNALRAVGMIAYRKHSPNKSEQSVYSLRHSQLRKFLYLQRSINSKHHSHANTI